MRRKKIQEKNPENERTDTSDGVWPGQLDKTVVEWTACSPLANREPASHDPHRAVPHRRRRKVSRTAPCHHQFKPSAAGPLCSRHVKMLGQLHAY